MFLSGISYKLILSQISPFFKTTQIGYGSKNLDFVKCIIMLSVESQSGGITELLWLLMLVSLCLEYVHSTCLFTRLVSLAWSQLVLYRPVSSETVMYKAIVVIWELGWAFMICLHGEKKKLLCFCFPSNKWYTEVNSLPSSPSQQRLHELRFLQKLDCRKPCLDQARLPILLNKQVAVHCAKPVPGFSKHRPSGPMLSISRYVRLSVRVFVCLSVCLCVCPSVHFWGTV